MNESRARIEENLHSVVERIHAAANRAGRRADEITLIAVTKYAKLEWIQELVSLGQLNLGENRPQQLWERSEVLPTSIHWHLIGHLQSNKVRRVLPLVHAIHSVDSVKLLRSISRTGAELSLTPKLLLEVNVTGEVTKDGFTPDEIRRQWGDICACEQVQILGLMTMAAPGENPDDARPAFQQLRKLRDDLQRNSPASMLLSHLSMGMTGDFEVAIEEGATFVRIGSALFEGLA